MKYDYLVVGSGLFGCVFANLAKTDGKTCIILEKRDHPFGNCYTKNISGIDVHMYGPHIFHTSNQNIWNYVQQFTKFNNFVYRPKVIFDNKLFSFPINLLTLYQLWGVQTPQEAKNKLAEVKININNPQNLEEWVLSQVGQDIYEKFIYGYTKKQWGTEPKNLPISIIKRIPIRLNFNDNYFNDIYQGIPIDGYSNMMINMTDGIEIVFNTNFLIKQDYWKRLAKKIVYTGSLDELFEYEYGPLPYRSLIFEHKEVYVDDFQGNAVINYTDYNIKYNRIIEHKHFNTTNNNNITTTIISKEFSIDSLESKDKFYPINTECNNGVYNKYNKLAKNEKNIIFGGRLAEYRYLDMHQIIGSAMSKYKEIK